MINKLNNYYEIKLSDFGESRFNKNTLANTEAKGTLIYMSPELVIIYLG